MSEKFIGCVLWCSNSIYYVECNSNIFKCTIKGKKITTKEDFINPICIGDMVEFSTFEADKGLILSILDRKNYFYRYFNKTGRKGRNLIASNVDDVIIFLSSKFPSIRQAFLDRILSLCEIENLPIKIVINKTDLGIDDMTQMQIEYYKKLGYEVFLTSLVKNEGIDALLETMNSKKNLIIGQSGVGKSSFINSVFCDYVAITGDISEKYNRGKHTTTMAKTYKKDNTYIIDSPGLKEFSYYPYNIVNIKHSFFEFANFECEFAYCNHISETGCGVVKEIDKTEDVVFLERYNNYLNILQEIEYI